MALNEKQKRFVREYLVDLNATQAAIRAGYSEKTAYAQGSALLKHLEIQAAVDAAKLKREERTGITADTVLNGIKRVIDRCEQAEPVLDREGNPTGEYTFQANNALRGYELLGKHLKLFADRVEHSLTEDLAERLSRARHRSDDDGEEA